MTPDGCFWSGRELEVLDTFPAAPGVGIHRVRVKGGRIQPGDTVAAEVDAPRRHAVMRNHTATHLLHAALRKVLGPHVKQAGSLVAPDRLRFDFTHFEQVHPDLLKEIEDLVNRHVLQDHEVMHRVMSLEEALEDGAMALFGEKYGEEVRTCRISDFSFELCGGTHVGRTGEIGSLKLVTERSVASGVRRVEALSGEGALARFRESDSLVEQLEARLNVPREKILDEIARFRDREKTLERDLAEARRRSLSGDGADGGEEREISGVKVQTRIVDDVDGKTLRDLADTLRDRLGSGVVVLGARSADKAQLLVSLTPDLKGGKLHAGRIVKEIAPVMGGSGGGRPDFAQAGGKDPARLPEAVTAAFGAVESMLSE